MTLVLAAESWGQGLTPLASLERYRSLIAGPRVLRGAAPSPAIAEAFARYQEGRFEGAIEQIDKIIDQMRDQGDRTRQAAAADFRGLIYQRQGKLDLAIDSHRNAIDLLADAGPSGLEARLNAMNNLAVASYFRGHYQRAEDLLSRIIGEPAVAPETRARARNNRGLIHQELGNVDKAIADFVQAELEGASDKRLRAQVLNNQARLWASKGQVDEAVKKLQEARRLAQEVQDEVLEANLLDSWGEVLLKAGRYEAALQKLDEARALEGKVGAPLIAVSIALNRGRALAGLGRPNEALAAYGQAITLAKDARLAALHREALTARAEALLQAGALDEALADYKTAVEVAEGTRDRLEGQTEQEFIKATERLYEQLVRALIRRGRPGDLKEALAYLDRSKSAMLHQLMVKVSPELQDKDAERELQGTKGLLNQEAALARELQQVLASGTPQDDKRKEERKALIDSLQRQLADVRQRVSVAVAELVKRYGGLYSAYVTVNPLTFRDVRDQLPAGRLLIEFFPAEDALYFFLVSRDEGVEFRQNRAVTKKALDEKILHYRQLMTKVRGSRAAWRIQSWNDPQWGELRDLTTWLYEALLQPMADRLARAEHVIFAPTGLLYYLPLHALGPFDQPTGKVRFLILQKPVSYLTTAALFKVVRGASKPVRRTLLALGNPPFQHPGLDPLTHAEQEVTALKTIFGDDAVVLPGAQATKQTLLGSLGASGATGTTIARRSPAGSGGAFAFLHLATHGVLDPRSPHESWLALDGTNKLVATEISTLDLKGVSLVTLSACETALAEERPGAELMSLATFITEAGASSVVVSLWSVDDRATRDLMVQFYGELTKQKSLDKAKALQRAQAALASKPETRHPFFWSPFILIGDWR